KSATSRRVRIPSAYPAFISGTNRPVPLRGAHISAQSFMIFRGFLVSHRSFMRAYASAVLAAFLLAVAGSHASAQFGAPAPLQLAPLNPAPGPASGPIRIDWEVRNRFRLFRNEADFRRHVAAHRGDGVLAAEQRLARASDGRGWARDMVDNLCVDQTGRLPET